MSLLVPLFGPRGPGALTTSAHRGKADLAIARSEVRKSPERTFGLDGVGRSDIFLWLLREAAHGRGHVSTSTQGI